MVLHEATASYNVRFIRCTGGRSSKAYACYAKRLSRSVCEVRGEHARVCQRGAKDGSKRELVHSPHEVQALVEQAIVVVVAAVDAKRADDRAPREDRKHGRTQAICMTFHEACSSEGLDGRCARSTSHRRLRHALHSLRSDVVGTAPAAPGLQPDDQDQRATASQGIAKQKTQRRLDLREVQRIDLYDDKSDCIAA
jgi:hypothetical protein